MPKSLAQIQCPKCGTPAAVSFDQFISAKVKGVRSRILSGEIGLHKCNQCDLIGIVPIQLIYEDSELDLLTFVCDGDRESLIDEFHDLLDICASEMGEAQYREILRRPFEIVVGIPTLASIIHAKLQGVYCYISTPGLSEVPDFDDNNFLIVAKYYRLAGRHLEAYKAVRESTRFPNSDPGFYRELGAYAYTANCLQEAEAALVKADELQQQFSHVFRQIVPAEGMLTKIPSEIALNKLTAKIKPLYQSMRPECSLSPNELADLAGTLAGVMERALQDIGSENDIEFFLGFVKTNFEAICNRNGLEQRESLEEIYSQSRMRILAR
jgi:hypothetical protein